MSETGIARVVALAQKWVDAAEAVKVAEETLKAAREVQRTVAEVELPDAMHVAGLSSFTMADGTQIGLEKHVTASWPGAGDDDRRKRAVEALEAAGASDLMKCDVVVAYSAGDREAAAETFARMRGDNRAVVTMVEKVHPQTLTAWVRRRLREGQHVDFDVFNVRAVTRATVK